MGYININKLIYTLDGFLKSNTPNSLDADPTQSIKPIIRKKAFVYLLVWLVVEL